MITAVERLGGKAVSDAMRDGAVVCTATQRLAHALRVTWDDMMRAEGRTAWRAPRILPYDTWLRRFVQDTLAFEEDGRDASTVLLTPQQEVLTWELALEDDGNAGAVLQPEMLAGLLMEAHALEHSWLIGEEDLMRHAGPGIEVYLRTRMRARERWEQRGQLPASMLPRLALRLSVRHAHRLPRRMVFAGFDLLPDEAFKAMHELLERSKVSIVHANERQEKPCRSVLRYADFEEEIIAAANWAHDMLRQGESDIGIVVPGLDRVRILIERTFSDLLSPSTVLEGNDAETGLFELSLGPRCADEPIINAGLAALELLRPRVTILAASRVLRSPFFAGAEEDNHRSHMDVSLRALGVESVSSDVLRHFFKENGKDDRLSEAIRALDPLSGRHPAREWAAHFTTSLQALGWPGDRRLSSREYQAVERWDALLEEFSAYDAVLHPLTLNEALSRFRRLVSERVFQPESRDAPIQIMGILETAGMHFAHCRVIGLSEEQWPPPARTNPFIPLSLQRHAGVTECLPDRYLAQMRGVMRRLTATSSDMVFSCSRMDADRELLPSPLLHDADIIDTQTRDSRYARRMQQEHASATEKFDDPGGPPVTETEEVRGGVRVLTLQSACPFRAYASIRLTAEEPETSEPGTRPLDRGNLLHEALRRIWNEIPGRISLNELHGDALRKFLLRHIHAAEGSLRDIRSAELPDHVRNAERDCVLQILEEWMDVECARGEFSVALTEGAETLKLGALALRLRIDRVDRLPDGRLLLIDYKSSRHGPAEWMQERPKEPQLPLYAVAIGSAVGALAFAVLRRGECGFSGIADGTVENLPLADVEIWLERQGYAGLSWEQLRAQWRDRLEHLADDFMQGGAVVDPRDGEDTCTYCTFHPFCRIDELQRERSA